MNEYFEQLNRIIEVENAIGSSKAWPKPDNYDDWTDCWEKRMNRKATKCLSCGSKEEIVGAHVIIPDEMNGIKTKVYLIILCKGCNNSPEHFSIDKTDLVDVTDICPFKDIIDNYR